MKYNFIAQLAVNETDSKNLADFVGGLVVDTSYKIQICANVNTELPDNLLAELKDKIDNFFTEKLGEEIEVTLVSVEH